MRVLAAAALLLLVAACDRSNRAPRTVAAPAAQPASAASVAIPAGVSSEAAATRAPAKTGAVAGASKPGGPKTASSAEQMYPDYARTAPGACAGLSGTALDDCFGLEPSGTEKSSKGADNPALADYRSQQEQRDQEMLDRDAAEARARERDDVNPPYEPAQEDIPPPDEGDMDEPPPGDEYGPPEDEPPPGEDDYPPPDDYIEPPYDH